MSESHASFRDLKGIGPATEVGIYSWEALRAAATALEAVRRNGDALRAVAEMVTAQSTPAGADRPPAFQMVSAWRRLCAGLLSPPMADRSVVR